VMAEAVLVALATRKYIIFDVHRAARPNIVL